MAHPKDEVGQHLENEVESSLAEAIKLAAAAGKWETVTELGRMLAERQRARTAPDVASLDAERARRTPKR